MENPSANSAAKLANDTFRAALASEKVVAVRHVGPQFAQDGD